LIAIEEVRSDVKPSIRAVSPAMIIVPSEPASRPQPAGTIFLRNASRFLYIGRARATVAGPSRDVTMSFAGPYSEKEMPDLRRTAMTMAVLNRTGAG